MKCEYSKEANESNHKRGRSEIRRTLTLHNALISQIKEKYKEAAMANNKTAVTSVVTGQIIRKYRLLTLLSSQTGISRRAVMKVTCGIVRKHHGRAFAQNDCRKVQSFF